MKRWIRTLGVAAVIGVGLHYLALFCGRATDGFSVAAIHSDVPSWVVESMPPSEQTLAALSQTFHYLGSGGQCFAFASEDGEYVIKFFKHTIRKPYSFLYRLFFRHKLDKALAKRNRDFTSYKMAYEQLRAETGLFHVHLSKDPGFNHTVHIVDKIGIAHTVALNNVEFVLQKRAQLLYTQIEELMQTQGVEGAQKALRAVLNLLVSRCQKGIFDEDPKIHRNLGFVEGHPIFIDVGRFTKDLARTDPAVYKQDLYLITKRLRTWLGSNYPELVAILDEELKCL